MVENLGEPFEQYQTPKNQPLIVKGTSELANFDNFIICKINQNFYNHVSRIRTFSLIVQTAIYTHYFTYFSWGSKTPLSCYPDKNIEVSIRDPLLPLNNAYECCYTAAAKNNFYFTIVLYKYVLEITN